MIEIPTQLRVGSALMPLARAYDNGGTVKRVLKKLSENRVIHATREVSIAQKTVTLIYCDPSKV